MILTKEQVNNYKQDGAIVVKDIFKPWINLLREGFEKVLKNPGPHARENVSKNENGRFLEDYCNWHRIPEFLRLISVLYLLPSILSDQLNLPILIPEVLTL